jgi:hypothetical protein
MGIDQVFSPVEAKEYTYLILKTVLIKLDFGL